MSLRFTLGYACALSLVVFAGCNRSHLPPYSDSDELAFRAQRARELADPHGDLAILRTMPIQQGTTTIGPAQTSALQIPQLESPIELTRNGQTITVTKAPAGASIDNQPLTSNSQLPLSILPNTNHYLTTGTYSLIAFQRSDGPVIRIFDSRSVPFHDLHPFNWFASSPKYYLQAEWIPIDGGQAVTMQRTHGGSDLHSKYGGYVQFQLDGKPMRLYGLLEDYELFFVFRDLTSQDLTYGAGRFLEVPFSSSAFNKSQPFNPARRSPMVLDFNRAVNPDCAYNPNTTCPIPPPENRLQVSIPAGEKRY